jgi:ribosome modulation factor
MVTGTLRGNNSFARASTARDRSPAELASMLSSQMGEITGAARVAGLENDPEVAAALALMAEAQRGLAAQSADQQNRTRQDLVASAASVRGKRNTFSGKADDGSPFVTKSQRTGWDLIKK